LDFPNRSRDVQDAWVRTGRQRLGFSASWNIAMSTVSVWSGGVLPFAHAVYWWARGVPIAKVEQAAAGSSRWDRMTYRERRVYAVLSATCVVVVLVALFVVVLASD
jgi:hypothetical protein